MATTKPKSSQITHGNITVESALSSLERKVTSVLDVKDFGAVGDGIADDTQAISSAIAEAKAKGGSTVFFPPGVYLATQIVIPRNVVLDGGQVMLVELKQIGGSNRDFIISEGFYQYTNTGILYPNDRNVPGWYGLKDMRVNGNKAQQTSGSGVRFYGFGQLLQGIVLVYDCFEDNIYTEASPIPPSFMAGGWQSQEEGFFETVISRNAGRHCWLNRGPHNFQLDTYLCSIDANATGWGFRSETSSTYHGMADRVKLMHIYSSGSNITNRRGFYFGTKIHIDMLYCDSVSCEISPQSGTSCEIDFLTVTGLGRGTNFDGIKITGSGNAIGVITAATHADSNGNICVDVSGGRNYIGNVVLYDNSRNPNNIGLKISSNNNTIANSSIRNFVGEDAVGLHVSGGYNKITSTIESCKTGMHYAGVGGNNDFDFTIHTSAGQQSLSGSAPVGTSDRFRVRCVGAVSGKNPSRVITTAANSNQINLQSTALQTVTIPHNCPFAINPVDVQLSFAAEQTDFTWALPPQYISSNATTITVACKLATASSVSAARGNIIASIRVGL